MEKTCPLCGNPVPPPRKTFCSPECCARRWHAPNYMARQLKRQAGYFRDNTGGYRDRHRNYMREYMREYRAGRRAAAATNNRKP